MPVGQIDFRNRYMGVIGQRLVRTIFIQILTPSAKINRHVEQEAVLKETSTIHNFWLVDDEKTDELTRPKT